MKTIAAFLLGAVSAFLNYQLNDNLFFALLAFIFWPVYLLYWLMIHGLAGGVIEGWFGKVTKE